MDRLPIGAVAARAYRGMSVPGWAFPNDLDESFTDSVELLRRFDEELIDRDSLPNDSLDFLVRPNQVDIAR